MAPLIETPQRHRPRFHPLVVSAVDRLTDDAVAVSFAVPEGLWKRYTFAPGQHVTLRATIDGQEVRRSYSICRSIGEASRRQELRVAAARVEAGVMSNWLNDAVRPGDEIDVMEPMGRFVTPPSEQPARHHVAIAAGSGITPVLALLTSALEDRDDATATLVLGNRRTNSIMFLEELADLKNAHPDRFQLLHVLSREEQDAELLSGRLDPPRLRRIIDAFTPADRVDEWYLCGPFGLVEGAQEVLADLGVPAERVHHEVFHVDEPGTPRRTVVVDDSAPAEATVTVNLDGRTTVVPMPTKDETILDATLRARPDAPYSCTGGVCGTCRARVVEGEVSMERNFALEPDEIAAGVVLACQSHPVTEKVVLDYDA